MKLRFFKGNRRVGGADLDLVQGRELRGSQLEEGRRITSSIKAQKGSQAVALVITLIMLAMVTVMAIIFLALARRERASVKLAEDIEKAKMMSQMGLERAKAQAVATMAAGGSKLNYDLFVSTNFYNFGGYDKSVNGFDPNNVSYSYPNGNPVTGDDLMQMLSNLQYDPRPPVFVPTNNNGATDFRFYLDFNRDRQFETNGVIPILNANGQPVDRNGNVIDPKKPTNLFKFVGDPEWVGVLERPDLPHSETNRFIGRYAFVALPAGKTLDLNYIHNQINPGTKDSDLQSVQGKDGFLRNQGYGSWEINMAAFLRELNTNTYAWHNKSYLNYDPTAAGSFPRGEAFDDAKMLLNFRYGGRLNSLLPAPDTLVTAGLQAGIANSPAAIANEFAQDRIDNFADDQGQNLLPFLPPDKKTLYFTSKTDDETNAKVTKAPWPGSVSSNAFTDVQQLFTLGQYSSGLSGFTNRLQQSAWQKKSSYDRYTFYRLLGQMGVDSTPSLKGKIHLNYSNAVGHIANVTRPWSNLVATGTLLVGTNSTPSDIADRSRWGFFMNAADLMLQASYQKRYVTNPFINGVQYKNTILTNYYIDDTQVRSNFSVTNIQIFALPPRNNKELLTYTGNEYSPTVNRILQLAANIYDSMTNSGAGLTNAAGARGHIYPHYPSVFRPIFTRTQTNVLISGWVEEPTGGFLLNTWTNLASWFTNTTMIQPGTRFTNLNFYGQPVVIGAKKGHPNFNEIALETLVDVSRKIELAKSSAGEKTAGITNQMFLVNMINRWGIEGWNSYSNAYRRPLRIHAEVQSLVTVTNFSTNLPPRRVYPVGALTFIPGVTNILITNWPGTTNPLSVQALLKTTNALIVNKPFYSGAFRAPNPPVFNPIEEAPRFVMYTTNRVRFWMYEDTGSAAVPGRLIDCVTFDNLTTVMDLATNLYSPVSAADSRVAATNNIINDSLLWDPTPAGGVSKGIAYQVAISKGEIPTSNGQWSNYRLPDGPDKNAAINEFRFWLGMPPLTRDQFTPDLGTRHQAPFTPTRRMYQIFSWQVNDPLVHYRLGDLRHPLDYTDRPQNMLPGTPLTPWNIGFVNDPSVYHPWSRTIVSTNDPFALITPTLHVNHMGLQDPLITRSDDWQFPIENPVESGGKLVTNDFFRFPNIGWLGRVHRGTPWQTVYLKSVFIHSVDARGNPTNVAFPDPALWVRWSGSLGTYPSTDYKLLNVFTVAPNENAARGLLSVNQENKAAWSAVLSGVSVISNSVPNATMIAPAGRNLAMQDPAKAFTPLFIEPGTLQLSNIWAGIQNYRAEQLGVYYTNVIGYPYPILKQLPRPDSHGVFEHVGEVLGTPALTVESPYLNLRNPGQLQWGLRDEVVERIPQQILSLLQRDEPRFVVYSFGQSLKPAPRSLATSSSFYNLCTNYQVTGEVITKTTFRVEGDLDIKSNPTNQLRAVIEDFRILPPPE